jgi:peroxiredoxin
MTASIPAPRWHAVVLRAAGVYNLAWGALAVLAPVPFLAALGVGAPGPIAVGFWQCIGMIVGVYGVGYWVAARDPVRPWPIVLVGLLGKVLGPIGFVSSAMRGDMPWTFGYTLLTNDLIWWVPFSLMLVRAADAHTAGGMGAGLPPGEAMRRATVDLRGAATPTLAAFSRDMPLLVVFLRHAGCTFCREAMAELRRTRPRLDAAGVRLVVVHMGDAAAGRALAERHGLGDVALVSDPERALYRSFNLPRGRLRQLFGPRVFLRGVRAAIFGGHGFGRLAGDGFQLPGVFLVKDSTILAGRPMRHAAERPDYCAIAGGVTT